MRIQAVQGAVAGSLARQEGVDEGVADEGVRLDAGAVVAGVDLEEDEGGVASRNGELGEEGDLVGVVDHDGECARTESGGDRGESWHGGRGEREGVEDLRWGKGMRLWSRNEVKTSCAHIDFSAFGLVFLK